MTEFKPAKRGDLVMVPVVSSVTYAFVSGRGTERSVSYALARVTSVTRDGMVKAAERPYPSPSPWKFAGCHVHPGMMVASADRFARPTDEIVAEINGGLDADFASPDDLRNVLRTYLKAA